jgi:hypothetical protein
LPGKNDTESAKFSSLAQISNITNDQIITTSTSSTHSMTPAKSFWDSKTKISQYLKCVKKPQLQCMAKPENFVCF